MIKFNDIQPGDIIRVSFPPRGGMSENYDITHSRTGMVLYQLNDDEWLTPSGQPLVCRVHLLQGAVVELLERIEHVRCEDCGKCRIMLDEEWCIICEYRSCERGDDCKDAIQQEEA